MLKHLWFMSVWIHSSRIAGTQGRIDWSWIRSRAENLHWIVFEAMSRSKMKDSNFKATAKPIPSCWQWSHCTVVFVMTRIWKMLDWALHFGFEVAVKLSFSDKRLKRWLWIAKTKSLTQINLVSAPSIHLDWQRIQVWRTSVTWHQGRRWFDRNQLTLNLTQPIRSLNVTV